VCVCTALCSCAVRYYVFSQSVHAHADSAQGVVQSVVLRVFACTRDSARVHAFYLVRLHLCARLCINVSVCAFLTAGMPHPVCCCVVTSACTCAHVHSTMFVAAGCWGVAQSVHARAETAQGVAQSVVLYACTRDSARVHTCVLVRMRLCARLCIGVCVCAFLTAGMQHPVCCCVVTSACTFARVHSTVFVAACCWGVAQSVHLRAETAQGVVQSVVLCACMRDRHGCTRVFLSECTCARACASVCVCLCFFGSRHAASCVLLCCDKCMHVRARAQHYVCGCALSFFG
jgi:hypothetical protein